MKRVKQKFQHTAWRYENMYPKYVSIVQTGANWIPFSTIKFSDEQMQEFTDGYEVASVKFPNTYGEGQAKQYLDSKGFTDYTLQFLDDGGIIVENPATFTDIKTITMGDIEVNIGKTNKAAKQVKTKIEDATPSTVDIKAEDTIALEDNITVEVDNVEDVADATEDTVEDVVSVSASTDDSVIETIEPIVDVAQTDTTISLAENPYIDRLKNDNPYSTVDTLLYQLRYRLVDILESKVDYAPRIIQETASFAEAIILSFSATDMLPEDSVVTGIVDTPAEESTETEDSVAMSDSNTNTVSTEDTSNTLVKLQEQVNELTNIVEKALNSKTSVDNTSVMMQTSKADVSAFDKGADIEAPRASSPHVLKQQKNLFGY